MKRKYNVIDSVWFGKTGIVKIDNGFKIKWYIGEGEGIIKEDDEQKIAAYGMPFYPQVLTSNFFVDNNYIK
jgi:hypothetical protein